MNLSSFFTNYLPSFFFLHHSDAYMDWKDRGLVEVFDDKKKGYQGVRVIQHIPQVKFDAVAKFHGASPINHIQHINLLDPEELVYTIVHDNHIIDLRKVWIGKINHAPPRLANLIAEKESLYAKRDIQKKEELSFNYGTEYWVFQLTHLDIDIWTKFNAKFKEFFDHMNEEVVDYTPLLEMRLYQYVPQKRYLYIIDLISQHVRSLLPL